MTGETPAQKKNSSMKTIDKAMTLLGFFLPSTPEWGLSDLARSAGMDKVTTMRILNSLAANGVIEQHPETRKYRLGTAVLRLARIREASFPVIALLQPILETLSEETGETAHASLAAGSAMTTIAIAEPHRATRVFVDPAQPLPLHATASGLVYLAHADDDLFQDISTRLELRPYTPGTLKSAGELRARIDQIRADGYAVSALTFEDDVIGVAAPIFDWHGDVFATIATACVSNRITDETLFDVVDRVPAAAGKATRAMGGDSTRKKRLLQKG